MGNLLNSGVLFSIRKLSKILQVSRKLIRSVLDTFIPSKRYEKKPETRGRKRVEEKHPKILIQLFEICKNYENVDKRMQDEIVYIGLTLSGIRNKLITEYDYSETNCPVENSIRTILIEKFGYKITRIKKDRVYKKTPFTNFIFKNVFEKLDLLELSDENMIGISIDDKVAKYIGLLSGHGVSWLEKHALDHDTTPNCIVKPFGIMDLKTKETFVHCTTSNSTADFKVDCIEEYLQYKLKENPNISKLLVFLDNGPENSSRRKLWKYRMINLAIKYNIQIELVYYPPYHSKYNKIEHYWGVLQKHWGRLIIDSLDKLIGAINSCKWAGMNSKGFLKEKIYEKGRKIDENELKELEMKHISYPDKNIKQWSLIISP